MNLTFAAVSMAVFCLLAHALFGFPWGIAGIIVGGVVSMAALVIHDRRDLAQFNKQARESGCPSGSTSTDGVQPARATQGDKP